MADWRDVHGELAGLIERLRELPVMPPIIFWQVPYEFYTYDWPVPVAVASEDYYEPASSAGKDGEA